MSDITRTIHLLTGERIGTVTLSDRLWQNYLDITDAGERITLTDLQTLYQLDPAYQLLDEDTAVYLK